MNLTGVITRQRHGYTEAVCPGCNEWVRLGEFYKGDETVIYSIPHIPRCAHFERVSMEMVEQRCGPIENLWNYLHSEAYEKDAT